MTLEISDISCGLFSFVFSKYIFLNSDNDYLLKFRIGALFCNQCVLRLFKKNYLYYDFQTVVSTIKSDAGSKHTREHILFMLSSVHVGRRNRILCKKNDVSVQTRV